MSLATLSPASLDRKLLSSSARMDALHAIQEHLFQTFSPQPAKIWAINARVDDFHIGNGKPLDNILNVLVGCPPVLALTATATDKVVQDIIKRLAIPDMKIINTGTYRPNLSWLG